MSNNRSEKKIDEDKDVKDYRIDENNDIQKNNDEVNGKDIKQITGRVSEDIYLEWKKRKSHGKPIKDHIGDLIVRDLKRMKHEEGGLDI